MGTGRLLTRNYCMGRWRIFKLEAKLLELGIERDVLDDMWEITLARNIESYDYFSDLFEDLEVQHEQTSAAIIAFSKLLQTMESRKEKEQLEEKQKEDHKRKREIKQMDQDLTELKNQRRCDICVDRPKTHAFVPCGHLTCYRCGMKVDKCPQCRIFKTRLLKCFL